MSTACKNELIGHASLIQHGHRVEWHSAATDEACLFTNRHWPTDNLLRRSQSKVSVYDFLVALVRAQTLTTSLTLSNQSRRPRPAQ